jgi:hypothetical protein
VTDSEQTTPAEISRADCRCCRVLGALPGAFVHDAFGRVLSQAVPGETIREMCSACIAGAFFGGQHPHDMAGARRAVRDAADGGANR